MTEVPPGTELLRSPDERPDPRWVLARLAERGIRSLLLEGGPHLNASFLARDLIDEVYWTIGAHLLGTDALPMIAPIEGGSPFAERPRAGQLVSVLRHDERALPPLPIRGRRKDRSMTQLDLGRLGVWGHLDTLAAPDAIAYARRAEELGYGTLWVPETVGREPIALCSLLAAATDRINLGTSIINIWGRDAQAARMARPDPRRGERWTVRARAGRQPSASRRKAPRPSVRAAAEPDAGVPRRLSRGHLPRPVAAGGSEPPVMVAALRERMVDLAATDADGALPYLVTAERVAWMRDRLDAAAGGRRPRLVVTLPAVHRRARRPRRRARVPEAVPAHADLPGIVGAPGLRGRRLGAARQRPPRRRDGGDRGRRPSFVSASTRCTPPAPTTSRSSRSPPTGRPSTHRRSNALARG